MDALAYVRGGPQGRPLAIAVNAVSQCCQAQHPFDGLGTVVDRSPTCTQQAGTAWRRRWLGAVANGSRGRPHVARLFIVKMGQMRCNPSNNARSDRRGWASFRHVCGLPVQRCVLHGHGVGGKERSTVTQIASRCNHWPVIVMRWTEETTFTPSHLLPRSRTQGPVQVICQECFICVCP